MSDAVSEKSIAVETSSRWGSVALGEDGRLAATADFPTQTDHARDLFPTVAQLCRGLGWTPGQITSCFVSIGPGSFTGLRVAVTFARHLALGGRVKVCAVPTLDVIAQNCAALNPPPRCLAVMLDAKRGQVFGARFEFEGRAYAAATPTGLYDPRELLLDPSPANAAAGEGIGYHGQAVQASGVPVVARELWPPRAAEVLRLGWRMLQEGKTTNSRDVVPFYVRRPEAEELWERRRPEKT